MNILCRLLILLLIFSITTVGNATSHPQPKVFISPIEFDHLSLEDGLSQATVSCMIQDSQGFMWFGTEDGLNRFDGYTFKVYRNIQDDPTSLTDSWVNAIYEDSQGFLWLGTEGGGLNRFDPKLQTFEHYQYDANDSHSLSSNIVLSLYQDKTGILWVGTDGGGLNRFNRRQKKFTRYLHDPKQKNSLSHNKIWAIHEDRKGNIWLGTYGGLNKFNRNDESFTHYYHEPDNPNSLSNNTVLSIYEDRAGFLWIGTEEGGLNKFDPRQKTFIRYQYDSKDPYSLSHNAVWAIFEDNEDTLWVGTHGGLNKFNRTTEQFTHYQHNPLNPKSLSHNAVWSIYQDKSDVLWISTLGGLNKFTPKGKKFIHYHQDPLNPDNSLSDNNVRAILETRDGMMWFGTYTGGLNRFDRKTNQFRYYQHDPNDPDSLSNNNIRAIFEDYEGMLWIGTYGSGLDKFDRKTQTFTHYTHDPQNPHSLGDNNVRAIIEDSNNVLWVGTYDGGLNQFNPETEQFIHYLKERDKGVSSNNVKVIYEDNQGALWIGTHNGLDEFDPARQHFLHYERDPDKHKSLSSNGILSIYQASDNAIWVGTLSGLNKLNRTEGTFTHYHEQDGLANEVIYGILEDTQGYLWLSTNKGISRFDPKTETIRNYDILDGLQSNEFNIGAYYKTQDGQMFFGGINGFNRFDPTKVIDNPYVPPVVLTEFQKFNKPFALPQSITVTKDIALSYKDYVFSFEFAALDFTIPTKNQYAYMLEGFDQKWNITDASRRFATYTNLSGGQYTFKVKASNNDSIWNQKGVAVHIQVSPPPWKTWWAYTLYVIATFATVIYYMLAQRRKLLEKQRELQREKEVAEALRHSAEQLRQADKLKDEFLANTSHELRTPLNGIIGLAESLVDGVAGDLNDSMYYNLSMIVSSGKRLANLVNDILDFSQLRYKEIELQVKPVDVREVVEVVLILSKTLIDSEKKLQLINGIPPDLPLVEADENRLQQILYNLIGNGVKFTEEGSVVISAEVRHRSVDGERQGFVAVIISDSGIGIPENKLERIFESFEQAEGSVAREYGGTGLGLAVTKQLIELHHGEIQVDSVVGVGSQFIFTLPIAKEQIMPKGTKSKPKITAAKHASTQEIQLPIIPEKSEGKFKVLIVDDEPVNIQVLVNHLALQDYTLSQASSGMEALEAIGQGLKPDIILLDVMMPKMSGYEVCRRLRKYFSPSELPIIMLTAKTHMENIAEGLEAGANDYLTKPVAKTELLARIKTHVQLYAINLAYGRFVPHEFLRFLGKESVVDVKLGDHVEKEMTVLFSDIRGFTNLSENMTPQENFNFINSYLSRMQPVIANYHGFIDKYIGDAIMALFPSSADHAVQAAIGMLNTLHEYNKTRLHPLLKIGIGLNTGELMLGTVGGEDRMDGTVISDAVNLASRVEGLTKIYGIALLITEKTYLKLSNPGSYNIRVIDAVTVKGKTESVTVYEVFDAEEPKIKQLKKDTLFDFEQGFVLYHWGEVEEAQPYFESVLQKNPDDVVSQVYLDRCAKKLNVDNQLSSDALPIS